MLVNWVHWAQNFILGYFLTINTIYLIFTIISLREIYIYIRTLYAGQSAGFAFQPISILVPAHNEEKTISSSIRSLLNLKYPEYEVIVINDGSSDKTMENLTNSLELEKFDKVQKKIVETKPVIGVYRSVTYPNLYVVDKEKGGKADALNAGINFSYYPLFCSVDADSILEEDALARASRAFSEDKTLIALGGIVRVLNGSKVEEGRIKKLLLPTGLIEKFQVIEYIRGFLTGRTAWNVFGSLLITSGAFSLFKKEAVAKIKGFRTNSVTEDMDLIVRLHRYFLEKKEPYRIMFIPDPICWTQVPSNWRSLLRQRNRWQRGLSESLWQNRKMFFNPKYSWVGMFGFPYFVFFEAIGPIVEMIGYLSVIVFYFIGELNPTYAILFFLVALMYGALLSVGAVLLENFLFHRYTRTRDFFTLALFALVEYFGYREVIAVERSVAMASVDGREWGRQKRKAI
jgi:cellulose synthase/poly-beta-1,6-N-acetylglucosamine synthase-like glycosyltransferase